MGLSPGSGAESRLAKRHTAPTTILIAQFKTQRIQRDLIHIVRSELFADGFQFPSPFRGSFGIRHLQFLERIK